MTDSIDDDLRELGLLPEDDAPSIAPEPEPEPKPSLVGAPDRQFHFYSHKEIKNRPKKAFLIGDKARPLFLEGGHSRMFGKEKSSKTYFALEISFCVAFGMSFAGLPTKHGKVIYVLAEGSIEMNYERIEALCVKYKEALIAELKLDPGISRDELTEAVTASGRLLITDKAINLVEASPKTPHSVGAFIGEVEVLKGSVVLIVLDTWARMLGQSGGHDSERGTVVLAGLGVDNIRENLDCAVLVIEHTSAANPDVSKGVRDPSADADGLYKVWKVEGPQGSEPMYHFRVAAARHGQEGYQINARLLSYEIEGNTTNSALDFIKLSPAAARVRSELKSARHKAGFDLLLQLDPTTAKPVSEAAWRSAFAATVPSNAATPKGQTDAKNKATDRMVETLVKVKLVELLDGNAWLRDPEEEEEEENEAQNEFPE
jgi:hypothetical protein